MAKNKKSPPQAVRKRKFRTKSDIMKNTIRGVCERYQMHADFEGGMVYITTIAGEWYFNFNDRPIQLRHKNAEMRFDQFGRSKGHYHLQQYSFNAPLQAISYIYNHERAAMWRLMPSSVEPITLQELLRQIDLHLLLQFIKLEYGISQEDEPALQKKYDELILETPVDDMEESTILVACVRRPEMDGGKGYESSYMLPGDTCPHAISEAPLRTILSMNVSRASIDLYGPVAVAASVLHTIWAPALSGEEQIKKSYAENKLVYAIITNDSLSAITPKE
ncbi:hypothetical protein LJC04_04495 [Ruminococcaceae bacterium OttesenSCG-928-O06]|nr:hypothetical protein [Ruminococcaceae bacterium OttesenSCG-928-O06]